MSKSEVESILQNRYHADILNAFKKMEAGNRIHASGYDKLSSKGRKKKYYKITKEGLKLLFTDNPDPEIFWKSMMGFCYRSDPGVSLNVIDELYNFFVNKYLKYPSAYGHSFHVDLFNEMSDQWLQNIILSSPRISCAQKILEVLANEPGITLNNLVDKTGETVEEVQKALSLYLPISHKPFVIGKEVKNTRYTKRDWKFFLHNTITVGTNLKNVLVYELSLFGIMLVLTLIRHNDMDRLRHGLYYTDLTFQEYHNTITSKYKNKLPLIFGKWDLLKKTLKELSGYGFDIILDKESRLKRFGEPVSLGGNKEFYDAALAIVQYSRKQLGELQIKGLMLYRTNKEEYLLINPNRNQSSNIEKKNNQIKNNEKKTEAIFSKLLEISTILDPQAYDPSSFKEMVKDMDSTIDQNAIGKISQLHRPEVIEKMFARDITSLFYLNLHNKDVFLLVGPTKYYSQKEVEWPLYPDNKLLSILEKDNEIRDWFSTWIEDLRTYQKETLEEMNIFHNKINSKNDL